MKVKITKGGGYQDVVLDVETTPRAGEMINLGNWEGQVTQVTHIPARYRGENDPVVHLVLAGSHQIRKT
jgi:hypothetical protein